MIRRITLLFVALLCAFVANATHIVGGSLTYEHIGGASYRVTLKMYRDCRPGNAAFAGSVTVQVRDQNGNGFSPSKDFTMPFATAVGVNPYIDTCAANPGLCLEEAIYTRVVNIFPPLTGGYFLFVRYCCRNSTLNNIVNPLSAGDNWNTHIPDMGLLITDNSPVWVNPPPVFVCQAEPINFDFSATDADGDSLVYSWFAPNDSMTPSISAGVATYTPVTYQGGYGPNNSCGGPNLTINPQTGYITGAPPNVGQFVAGVRVEEYRNGVKIGEIKRDFQFNVIFCPPVAQANLGTPAGVCSGSNVQFVNNSDPTNSYFWNFGDPAATNDTSNIQSPNYTYPGLGPYNVYLVINVGTACADTAYQTVQLSYVTTALSPSNDSACVGQPITFTDNSVPSPNSTISSYWWDFGDMSTSTQQNPTHTYNASGTYTIYHAATNDLGCDDTITQNVYIIAPPIALAGNDTFACTNNATFGLGGNVLNSSGGGYWSGAGTFTPDSTVLNATYTPTAAEIAQGFTYLTLTTTGASLCSQDIDSVLVNFTPGPTVDVGPDIIVCRDTAYVAVCSSFTLASGVVWSTSGCGSFANPTDSCTTYIPCLADQNAGQVYLFSSTTGNGSCTSEVDTLILFLTPPPNVSASGPDTACSNLPFIVTANTATGQGFWTSNGDGTFPGGSSGLSVNYLPGTNDLATGSVTIVFNSLNNGGCQQQRDTLFVIIIPAPNANFTWASECPGVQMQFTDASTSVTPVTAWNWNFGNPPVNNTSNAQNPTHAFPAGGSYNVTLVVTSANGCPDSVVLAPQVYPDPNTDFTTAGYCLKDGTQFIDSSTIASGTIVSYEWNFGDNTNATGTPVIHTYNSSANWNVTLITTSNFGCKDTITKPVTIFPSPTAAFTANPATAANAQQLVSFTDQSYFNIVDWWWDFGDSSSIITQQNPNHSYMNSGTYPVTLVVSDTNGCTDTTVQDYIITAPPVVPNAFSPNGDGQNDFFWVRGGPFTDLELRIYNNWGELIYVGTNQSPGWDGTRDGIPQPIGVYVYTVYAKTPDGKEHQLHGDVTLLR
ncbi:MAG: PKD domain-containing protein [Bacteroidia bacterium]